MVFDNWINLLSGFVMVLLGATLIATTFLYGRFKLLKQTPARTPAARPRISFR